ncbi:MAG: hypothetical protein JRJ19_10870 [Deltaproteobacteria bacterium]|nr:hypothetical protein [Deltaproteobacteria bacterium]MBW1872560.1 hypothetical protein [Deltaproteobacteria bacterium]
MSVVEKAKEIKKNLEAGEVTVAEIVAWADEEIVQSDQPLDEIIELSMVENANDAITWLSNLLNNHGS